MYFTDNKNSPHAYSQNCPEQCLELFQRQQKCPLSVSRRGKASVLSACLNEMQNPKIQKKGGNFSDKTHQLAGGLKS